MELSKKMFLHTRLGYQLGGFLIASGLAFLSSEKVAEANQSLIWIPESPQDTIPQFQPQQSIDGFPVTGILTEYERQQTLQALELVKILEPRSLQRNQIPQLQEELGQLSRQQSSPYQLSPAQITLLREIFGNLSSTEVTAINQILLTQTVGDSITLTRSERESLRQFLAMIPSQNFNNSQREQLIVIQEFLAETSQEETISLSLKQTAAFQSAIAFVFFNPETQLVQTAQRQDFDPSRQAVLTQVELAELITGLQAIQKGRLRVNQDETILRLITELEQLQRQTSTPVILSSRQTQRATELINSLTPNEEAAVEILVLSDRAPETIRLTQPEIDNLIGFFQGLPTENLTTPQQEERAELIDFLTQLQGRSTREIQLSSAQTERLLQGVQRLVFGGNFNRPRTTAVSLNELQQILNYLGTAQQELSLSPSQRQVSTRLIGQLSLLEATPDRQFIISQTQNQKIITFLNSLQPSERRQVELALVDEKIKKVVSPAISHANPIGYGNSSGQIDVGVIFETPNRFGDAEDGSIAASVGFGDPYKTIGVDATLTFYSLTGENESDPLETGSLSFEVSRNFSSDLAVSFGIENLIRFSPDNITPPQTNFYLVGTQRFQLREDPISPFGLAYVTAGIGDGRFSSVNDFEFDENGSFNLFGSVAVQIIPRVNGIAEWTGQDLNAGVSVVPFRELPLVVNLMAVDIFGNVEDEFGQDGRIRFSGSLNYGFFF